MGYNRGMDYEIKIVRSFRRTVSLTVERDGSVKVRVPYGVSGKRVSEFVARHRLWIERRLAERKGPHVLAFGGTVTLFGREYLLREGKPRLTETELFLSGTNAEGELSRILKGAAEAYFCRLTREIAERHGFEYASVRISSARARWGSCNAKGAIAYTYRLAFLPEALSEYVAVHELCHTRRFSHGKEFWREVEKVLPDFRRRRADLKKYSFYMQPVRLEKNGKIL